MDRSNVSKVVFLQLSLFLITITTFSGLPIENGCHGSGRRLVNEAMDRIFAGEIHTIMEALLLYSPNGPCLDYAVEEFRDRVWSLKDKPKYCDGVRHSTLDYILQKYDRFEPPQFNGVVDADEDLQLVICAGWQLNFSQDDNRNDRERRPGLKNLNKGFMGSDHINGPISIQFRSLCKTEKGETLCKLLDNLYK